MFSEAPLGSETQAALCSHGERERGRETLQPPPPLPRPSQQPERPGPSRGQLEPWPPCTWGPTAAPETRALLPLLVAAPRTLAAPFSVELIWGTFMTSATSRPGGETLRSCCLRSRRCPSAPAPHAGSSLWRAWGSVSGTLPGAQAWLSPCGHGLVAACVLRVPGSGAPGPRPGGTRGQSRAGPAPTTRKLLAPPLSRSTSLPLKMVRTGPTAKVGRGSGPPTPGLAVPCSPDLRTPLPSPQLGREGSHVVVADLLPRWLAPAGPRVHGLPRAAGCPPLCRPPCCLLTSLSLFLSAPSLCAP